MIKRKKKVKLKKIEISRGGPKAEAFFPSASASAAEAFWQKVGQKVSFFNN